MGSAIRWGRLLALPLLVAAALAVPASASASLATLAGACETIPRDAADNDAANGLALPFYVCDDGIPTDGGRDPNVGGVSAIEVPAAYDGHRGLPAQAAGAAAVPGADPTTGKVALDANLSFPDPARFPVPAEGYPLVVFMHGCCSGSKTSWQAETVDAGTEREKWHYSNAWFASRGYAVLTYTARGFVAAKGPTDLNGNGSTGETQIDHRAFEINDFQHLAGLIAEESFTVGGQPVTVDGQRVVATGGSYGGGFAWLALTDPTWESPNTREPMRLVTAAPRYGWSDLAQSLVPNGAHREGELPPTDPANAYSPFGFPKRTIVAALFATGQQGATFPQSITEAFTCLQSPVPFAINPLCATTRDQILPSFIADRSSYYQNEFFAGLASGSVAPVPVFSAGTLTDPLFPGIEHRRMVARLKAAVPDYPVQEYYGDYQHFVQNKRKEWADLCGSEVCLIDDFPGGDLNTQPTGLTRSGVSSRLSRFVDHYAKPQANPAQAAPARDVTAALQICPANASAEFPADGPGETFTAPTFGELAPNTLTVPLEGEQRTTNKALPNLHAINADPLLQLTARGGSCPVDDSPAGPGVATYDSPALPSARTMIGPGRVTVPYSGTGAELQLNARLYDVFPNGSQVMVDRGWSALTSPNGTATIDLLGNAWRFPAGHRLRLELAQDDDPTIRSSATPSSLVLAGGNLALPIREGSSTLADSPAPVDRRRSRDRDRDRGRGRDRDRDEAASSGGGGGVRAASGSDLPFTGLELGLVLGAGLLLLGGGVVARRALRSGRSA